MTAPSVDRDEVAFFAALADQWWDPHGPFRPLHILGPTRLAYIRQVITKHFDKSDQDTLPFKGLKILDIGCGGGLVSEPLARLGGSVTGIDASAKNIGTAKAHLAQGSLHVDYRAQTAESLLEELNASGAEKYDVIVNMEVIEHVADVQGFLDSCAQLLKDGGVMIVSTINRTAKAWLFAIVGAEYVLRWLPVGAHDWSKFLKPDELKSHIEKSDLKAEQATGFVLNPLNNHWRLTEKDLTVNYAMWATKPV